jgi:hypothetical protein
MQELTTAQYYSNTVVSPLVTVPQVSSLEVMHDYLVVDSEVSAYLYCTGVL